MHWLTAVYDGHGIKGHEVSQYVARELPRHILGVSVTCAAVMFLSIQSHSSLVAFVLASDFVAEESGRGASRRVNACIP